MECFRNSRIPHLALSISTKRASVQSWSPRRNARPPLQRSDQYYAALSPSLARSRVESSVRNVTYRRHASTSKAPQLIPAAQRESQPQHKPRPTLAQRAATQDTIDKRRIQAAAERIHMSSNTYFWVCSLFGFALSTYIMYTYMSYRRSLASYKDLDLPQNADVSSRWMDMSRNFDDEVELSEKAMFLRSKRENLCREARGNVLEVSAGTGRNMDLYKLDPALTREEKKVKSLVFNDLSEIMLYQAQKKFEALQEKIMNQNRRFVGPVQFVVGDAGDKRLIKRPEGGFDTIIQTMGICSETEPVAFLKQLGELCRQPGEKSTGVTTKVADQEAQQHLEKLQKAKNYGSSEPEQEGEEVQTLIVEAGGDLGGKILLLEHGRSNLGIVNQVLDNGAKMHADHYGCWWNKDIEQVVKDSGLIVERKRRYHFGTTYEYVLRPRPKSKAAKQEVSARGAKIQGLGGWFSGG